MKVKLLIVLLNLALFSYGQAPKIYINFVSHNEPGDNLQNSFNFNLMVPKVLELASIIDSNGASWNLQTCDGFANGAYNLQGVNSNVFKTLVSSPYNDNIEIDPRNKNITNVADLFHTLDTLGAKPTTTLGGFVYSSTSTDPDWFQYQDTISGITYPWTKWKCSLMWGAGSLPPHDNDLNDYGIWKPDSLNTFYNHNSGRSIWFIGNGCQPLLGLDSTENEQIIISALKGTIDSIQNGSLPQNKFYVYSITINQSHFGPALFQKISTICDSVNSWGTGKIQWATLTQKFSEFQAWQISSGLTYSQWLCGQSVTPINEQVELKELQIFPNPSAGVLQIKIDDNSKHHVEIYNKVGQLIHSSTIINDGYIDISELKSGTYIVRVDNKSSKLILID